MSTKLRSSNEDSEPARNMDCKVDSKRGSRQQQWTTAVKEKILSPQGRKSSKFQDKCEAVNPSGKLYADHQHNGSRQHMDDKHAVQLQPSVAGKKQQLVSKTNKDDELVKYMSNLPGYLQQAEKQKNDQVNALNFGVLDWKRLEKWKYNERMLARDQPRASSSGNSLSMENGKSTLPKTSGRKKQYSVDLDFKSPVEVRLSDDVRQSQGKKHIQDPQTLSQSTIAGQQKDFYQSLKSSSRKYPPTIHEKGKKKEADKIERIFSMSSLPFGKQHGKSRTTVDNDINDSPKYCNAEPQNIVLLMPKCPSKANNLHDSRSSASSNKEVARDGRTRYSGCSSSQELQSGEFGHEIPHSCPRPPSVAVARESVSDVCAFPRERDKSTEPLSSEAKCPKEKIGNVDHPISADTSEGMRIGTAQKTETRALSHRHFADGDSNRYSDCFSPEELQFHYEMLHSCPLPANVAISQGMGSDFSTYEFQNDTSIEPRISNATCPESKSCDFDDSVSVECFKEMDMGFAKQTAGKGRHPSPSRRFSFSLGRLSRSFSFKESSTPAQLTSTFSAAECGTENFEVSAGTDDTKRRDKANASGRRRPSPFRRLLDPLLKPKVAQCIENNSSFVTLQPNNTDKPLSSETNPASTFQALMQFTVKNGLPFFKFVVDNRSDILAAALKQLPSSGKADRTLTYSFYSVHEIKKKAGGWITNGSKEKNCGFGYDTVGQMKITNSSHSEFNAEDCNEQYVVTESVLYDVNITKGEKGTPDVSLNREIAAIILKDPIAKCNDGSSKAGNACKQKDFLGPSPGNTCDHGEKENCNSTTVILPSALHSLPNDGAPSSLIHRWKSGGLCDCGGWDVGCKLRILTNRNQGSNFSTPAMSYSVPERMNLFTQGGDGKSQPIFSLSPFKDGFYSVELSSSVSLLEGFSICVAVITSREFSDIFDIKHLPEAAKLSVEVKAENDKKNEIKLRGDVPAKFVKSPPSSPVGRI